MRKALVILVALMIAAPAMATTTWDIQGGGASEGIDVTLDIDGYIQIIWQDLNIAFSGGNDWQWNGPNVRGDEYFWNTVPVDDPWTEDYYESGDAGYVYVKSNTTFHMVSDPDHNLEQTIEGHTYELPTWFTLCACPFILNGETLDDGVVPGSGGQHGSYAADEDADGTMELGGTAFWGNQYCFPFEGPVDSWTLNLPGASQGTLLYHARVDRNGITDAAGSYSATLTVSFAE